MLFYDNMKAKQQKNFNEAEHWFNLFNVLQAMFEWDGLPDTIMQEQLEGILISNGTVGIGKLDGELWCGYGSYCGEVRGFLPSQYQFAVQGIGNVEGRWDKDIAVGWNNATFTPDLLLMKYASILTEIDISEKANLLYTRFIRIPKVKNQKEKAEVMNAIKAIQTGKLDAWVSDSCMDGMDIREVLGSPYSKDREPFLDLVDVKEVDKLQYLSQYRENIIKRFFQIYGISTQVTQKLAQQNTDEIHANDDVSMTLFMQRYKYRKKLAEDMNQKFGLNVTVRLSEGWQDSYEAVIKEDKEEGEQSENMDSKTDS